MVSYTNEEQVFHAQTPVELIGDEELTVVADEGSSQPEPDSIESPIDQLSKVDSDQNKKTFNAPSYSIN